MVENKSKHTFILAIDEKTVQAAWKSLFLTSRIQGLIEEVGFTQEDGTVSEKGLYYKKEYFI